jgi:hypothetical protein
MGFRILCFENSRAMEVVKLGLLFGRIRTAFRYLWVLSSCVRVVGYIVAMLLRLGNLCMFESGQSSVYRTIAA